MAAGNSSLKNLSRFAIPFYLAACVAAIAFYIQDDDHSNVFLPFVLLGAYCAWHDYEVLVGLRRKNLEQRREELFSESIAISSSVISAIESASLPELILSRCEDVLKGTTRLAFFEADPKAISNPIRVAFQKGFAPETINRFTFPLDKSASGTGRAMVQNEILVVSSQVGQFWCNQEFIDACQLKQFIIIPFVVPERPVGALLIEYSERLPKRLIVEALSPLKDQIPIAIENRRLYKTVQEISIHDEMTGLYNYRFFRKRLQEELDRSRRYEHKMSLVILDIDHFKQFNDEFGHQIGDRALRVVADALTKFTRSVAVVARYGGEEFVIIEPEAEKEQIHIAAERIRQEISRLEVLTDEKEPTRPLRVSAGIATFPEDGPTADDIVQQADEALLYSKQTGRNRVTLAPAPPLDPGETESEG